MHYESKTRGYEVTPEKNERFNKECENFKTKWKEVLKYPEPYYNPNISRNTAMYDIEENKITKERKGDKYIITIPFLS